jgi:hypothetical protein
MLREGHAKGTVFCKAQRQARSIMRTRDTIGVARRALEQYIVWSSRELGAAESIITVGNSCTDIGSYQSPSVRSQMDVFVSIHATTYMFALVWTLTGWLVSPAGLWG